jgi:hypothetical protein
MSQIPGLFGAAVPLPQIGVGARPRAASPFDRIQRGVGAIAHAATLGALNPDGTQTDPTVKPATPGLYSPISPVLADAVYVASAASTVAMIYHGWKRTKSVGWTAAYGLFGAALPVISVGVALAQGFGKRKTGK